MDPRVQAIIDLLRTHADQRFTIEELARSVNLSESRLTHLFVQQVGLSPSQFFRHVKFERARYLLQSSFLSIKEIINVVGFNDKSHFAKDFKRIYGFSPTEYRRRHAVHLKVNGQQIRPTDSNKRQQLGAILAD